MGRVIALACLLAAPAAAQTDYPAENVGLAAGFGGTVAAGGALFAAMPWGGFWRSAPDFSDAGATSLWVGASLSMATATAVLDVVLSLGHRDRALLLFVGHTAGVVYTAMAALVYALMVAPSYQGCDELCTKMMFGVPLLASAFVPLIIALFHYAIAGDEPHPSASPLAFDF